MKSIELMKLRKHSLVVLLTDEGVKREFQPFVVCRNYDPEAKYGEQWDYGHYFTSLENAVRELNNKGMEEETYLYQLLKQHIGHEIEIAEYGNGDNFALEDVDTGEVIFDTDGYDLIGLD